MICRCRACQTGIIGGCVAAWLFVSTPAYPHDALEVDAVPLGAFSGLTVTSGSIGITLGYSNGFHDRAPSTMPMSRS
jgi:hypothetical protein